MVSGVPYTSRWGSGIAPIPASGPVSRCGTPGCRPRRSPQRPRTVPPRSRGPRGAWRSRQSWSGSWSWGHPAATGEAPGWHRGTSPPPCDPLGTPGPLRWLLPGLFPLPDGFLFFFLRGFCTFLGILGGGTGTFGGGIKRVTGCHQGLCPRVSVCLCVSQVSPGACLSPECVPSGVPSVPRCPCAPGMCPLRCPKRPQLSTSPLRCPCVTRICVLGCLCVPGMYPKRPQVSLCPHDVSLGVPASLGCVPSGVRVSPPVSPGCVPGCPRQTPGVGGPGRRRGHPKVPKAGGIGHRKSHF